MGRGGRCVIVNTTDLRFQCALKENDCQDWAFPEIIEPRSYIQIYAEQKGIALFHGTGRARAVFTAKDLSIPDQITNVVFTVEFMKKSSEYIYCAYMGSIKSSGCVEKPFVHDGRVMFYLLRLPTLTPTYGFDLSSSVRNVWVSNYLYNLGYDIRLGNLCLPGAYKAGMSHITYHTFSKSEYEYQVSSVYELLQNGCRVLDLLPIIGSEEFFCGSYDIINGIGIGARGVSINMLIEDINAFVSQYPEPIFITISDSLYTNDTGNYKPLGERDLKELFDKLEQGLHLLYRSERDTEISKIQLSKIFFRECPERSMNYEDKLGAVFILLGPSVSVAASEFIGKGFYRMKDVSLVHDESAGVGGGETDNDAEIINLITEGNVGHNFKSLDQLVADCSVFNSKDSYWDDTHSIIQWASSLDCKGKVNENIFNLFEKTAPGKYPRWMYFARYSSDHTLLAIAMNLLHAPRCKL